MNDEIVKPLRGGAAHLVIEHDGFHAGLLRHAADVARRRVRLGDVAEDALGIAGVGRFLGAAHVVLVSAVVQDLADEHVGAARETHEVRRVRRVAREADRARARLEAVAERAMLHARDEALGEMRVGRGRHDDAVVGEHADRLIADVDVVAEEQRFRLHGAAFVDHADLDVGAEERDRALNGAGGGVRAVDVRRRRFAARPLVREHRREVGRVIVVQVRQEHRAHGLKA